MKGWSCKHRFTEETTHYKSFLECQKIWSEIIYLRAACCWMLVLPLTVFLSSCCHAIVSKAALLFFGANSKDRVGAFLHRFFKKKKKRFMAIISLLWWINTTIQRIAKAYRHYSESHVMNKVNYVEKKLQNADASKSNLILCIKKCYLKSEFVHPLCNRQSLLSILKLK